MSLTSIFIGIFIILYFINLFDNLKKSNFHASTIFLLIIGFALFVVCFIFFRNKYIYLFLSPIILIVKTKSEFLEKFIKFLLYFNLIFILLEFVIFYSYGKLPLDFIYNSGTIFNLNNSGVVVRDIDGFLILRPRGLTGDLHVSAFLVFLLLTIQKRKLNQFFLTLLIIVTNSVQTLFTFFIWLFKKSKLVINFIFVAFISYFILKLYFNDGTSESTISGIINGYKELNKLTFLQLLFGILDPNQLINFEIDSAESIESGFVKLIILYGVITLIFLITVLLMEAKRYSKSNFAFLLNIFIIYFCFAHSSVGSSIWIFPLLHLVFGENIITINAKNKGL